MEFSAVKPEKLSRMSACIVNRRSRVRVAPPALSACARQRQLSPSPFLWLGALAGRRCASFAAGYEADASARRGAAKIGGNKNERLGLLPVTEGPVGMVPSQRPQVPLMLRCSASGLASRQRTGVGYTHSIGQNNA